MTALSDSRVRFVHDVRRTLSEKSRSKQTVSSNAIGLAVLSAGHLVVI